jgi:hypothetical protein
MSTRRSTPIGLARFVAVALLVSGILAMGIACRDGGGTKIQQPAASPSARAALASEVVSIDVPGRGAVGGRLYGRRADNGVVLMPTDGSGVDVWEPYAGEVAASGLMVLALDRVDATLPANAVLSAAVAMLRSRGVDKVVLVGEGAGGTAAVVVAGDGGVSGVAALSSPTDVSGPAGAMDALASIARVDRPVLFMAALADPVGAPAAGRLYDAARDPRTRALVSGSDRGAEILRGGAASEAKGVLNDFLRESFRSLTA